MDSRCNKSRTEDNATKVFELIITNPCSEPSKPVDISCVFQDLTAKTNVLDNMVSKDGFTDSEPIVIDDLDNEEVKTTDENLSKDDAQKSIEANIETRNNIKESVVKISFDCNDNQKESTESVIILDETKTDLNQTKLTSSQLTKKVVQNYNPTTDSDLDLYETELQNAFDANKTNSRIKRILEEPSQNGVDIDTGKYKRTEKAVCSDNIARKDNPTIDIDIDSYETESQNVITLSGNKEDSDVIVLDGKTSSDSTISQADNEITISAKEYPPIDLVDEDDSFSHNEINEEYAEEFKKNSLLAELVQKCINMERNGGMIRVINRTLLNIYKSVEEKYKKSDELRKVLTRTIMKLHMEPELKFSHIKCLCDHLKFHMIKKRVPFVTLEKRSSGDRSTSTVSKKRRVETIDLDNYAVKNKTTTAPMKPKEYPPIEIDDSSSSIEEVNNVILVDNKKAKKKKLRSKKKKKQKGGLARAFIPTLVRNPFCTVPDLSLNEIPTSNETERIPGKPNHPVSHKEPKQISKLQPESMITQRIDSRDEPQIISQSLLTPIVTEPVQLHSGSSDQLNDEAHLFFTNEIEEIEKHIAYLREKIEQLEEMEVQVDDETSPYIVSEQYQSMLVSQYKRLCELTGTQEKKQHKVRLQVLPGHPEAPVQYLQEFLNNNIDEEGNPPFPDLYDVIQCVCKANVECNMNWGQAQIMKEARSLFIQFGQTMQKRRQKREWKDLMSRVKEEVNDPAEQDVELMMKLNRNSWIAKQKEKALLDRYASLEQTGVSARIANELSAGIQNGVPEPETDTSDDENADPRMPCSSIQNYERQKNIGSFLFTTNGSVGISAAYEKQSGSLVIPATYEKQNGSLGIPTTEKQNERLVIPATYEKQNEILGIPTTEKQKESVGIPATYEKQKIVGSTITLSNGCIQIAPTYDVQKSSIVIPNGIFTTTPFQLNSNNIFGVPSTQNATNTSVVNGIQNVTSPGNNVMQYNNDLSMYSLEFQKFTSKLAAASNAVKLAAASNAVKLAAASNAVKCKCNLCTDVQSNVCLHNRNVITTVNNHNVGTVINNVSTVINPNVGTNLNVSAVNNNVYLVNNSNVNTVNSNVSTANNRSVCTVNSIASAVNNNESPVKNSNLSTVNNSIEGTVNSDEVQSKIDLENATNLAKTIMELLQNDVSHTTTYGNKNSKEVANSHGLAPESTDAKVKEETDEKLDESVCDIFIHKTLPTNKNTVNENTESKETPKCTETKSDKRNVANQANVEASSEIETKDVAIEDKIKPEPRDIPRMLAELGEQYTAEVFDIEDPFLVIEISDSSESEDEFT